MNDPYQTMRLPAIGFSGDSKGGLPPGAPKDTAGYPQIAVAEPSRFEPTVLDAIRRYRITVLAAAVLGLVIAVGYSRLPPKVYRAQAQITLPEQASLQGQATNSGQYLDSQVLSLQSQDVAQLAVTIANAELHSNGLAVGDLFGSGSSLQITPPLAADIPGAYGSTIIGVSFAASTAQVAQVGTNAVIQAYDQTRSATIRSQANAAIKGIDNAISNTNNQLTQLSANGSSASPDASDLKQQLLAQRGTLVNQRTEVIADEQIDLAQQPAVASDPATITNRKWALDGGIGLIIGILIGSALAFMRGRHGQPKVARSRESPSTQGVRPSSTSDHWTATAASPQRPPQR